MELVKVIKIAYNKQPEVSSGERMNNIAIKEDYGTFMDVPCTKPFPRTLKGINTDRIVVSNNCEDYGARMWVGGWEDVTV